MKKVRPVYSILCCKVDNFAVGLGWIDLNKETINPNLKLSRQAFPTPRHSQPARTWKAAALRAKRDCNVGQWKLWTV